MGNFHLTCLVKIGYNTLMLGDSIYLLLRLGLIISFCAFIWHVIKPKTQLMRTLRAALLVLGLVCILVVLRTIGL